MSARMSLAVRLTPLAMAIALLGGCAAPPKEPPASPLTNKSRFSGATLADLETRQIIVEAEELAPQSAEETLSNYQTALALFRDPNARLDTMRRMAELTMSTSQAREDDETAATTSVAAGESEEVLYERFMQGMASSRDRNDTAAAAKKPQPKRPEVNYKQAVALYEDVVKNAAPGPEKANGYYELAKAYDLNNQREESVVILRKLVDEYPGSQYATEAQFRVAEYEFSINRFAAAADNYAAVVNAEGNTEFRDQALYKQAWALYKASDYEAAQPLFFKVVEEWQAKAKTSATPPTDTSLKLLADTYNIISLGFIQQDGAKSVDAYFKKTGAKDYESDVYMNLGETYLSKRLYRNAAETFDYFVAKYPFDSQAPEFSSATIRAYQEGGFPSEVIPAKENFVKRYGPSSEFWARVNAQTRQDLLPLLQSHIIDLAKHQHAVAQQSKKPDDYLKAASWYRQHLALNPPESEALTINQLLAEALFAARKFDDAITEFEKTAYDYPSNPKPEEAAYFAMVAYLEQEPDLPQMSADAKQSWWTRRTASTYKFAERFPGDKNTPGLLQGLTNDQIANKDLAGAMKTAGIVIQLQPPAPDAVVKEAWMVMGDGEFDLNRPEAAEFAYTKVLAYNDLTPEQRKQYQGRLTASVYKQAEKLRDSKDVDGAVAAYLRAASVATDAKFKAGAEFDAATMYLNAERYAEAIPMLVAFRNTYPGNELNETIPEKLALSYEKTGQLDLAAAEYEGISARSMKADPELARQALWTAAEMYDKSKRGEEAVRVYRKYIATFPKPIDTNMEALFRIHNFYVAQGNTGEVQNMLREIARSFDRAGAENTARTSYLGAMAKFRLSQPVYDEFAAIQLRQPLKKTLASKRVAMQKALDTYSKVAAIGVAEFTTASNYQIAEIYRKLAADLMGSERPKGLNELELEQYAILLEEQATPFEDKALDLYIANANLVKQNIYDDFVRQSFDALAKLSPGRYNKREQSETYVDVIY
ncbi:MAG: tetratricopeptide repeat protein [Moraxellaceae bacterium]|nr:tetratricopeptide repeat protein [Moraxellaceae bacterium]